MGDEARYQEFVRNDKRWTRTTSRAVEAHDNHCVNLKYEDDLSTPTALAETVRWLHDRYALDLNHEATKLLKLERVNAPVTAADIVNVRASTRTRNISSEPPSNRRRMRSKTRTTTNRRAVVRSSFVRRVSLRRR